PDAGSERSPESSPPALSGDLLRGSDGRRLLGLREHHVAVARVHADEVSLAEVALEDRERQAVDQVLLDHPLQRPRPVRRVVAEVAEQQPGVVGQLDLDAALAHALEHAAYLEVDDLPDLRTVQRAELDDVVQAVDELRAELGLHAGAAAWNVRGH